MVVRDAGGCLKHRWPAANCWGFTTLVVTHSPVGCTRYVGGYRVFVFFAKGLGVLTGGPRPGVLKYTRTTYDSRNPPVGVVACWRRRGVMVEVAIALYSQSPAWRDGNPQARLARMVVLASHLRKRKPATCLRRPQAFAVAGSVVYLPPMTRERRGQWMGPVGSVADEGGSETTSWGGAPLSHIPTRGEEACGGFFSSRSCARDRPEITQTSK